MKFVCDCILPDLLKTFTNRPLNGFNFDMFLIYRDDYTINVHSRYSILASICQGIVKFVFYWYLFAPCWILMSNDLLTPFEVLSFYLVGYIHICVDDNHSFKVAYRYML